MTQFKLSDWPTATIPASGKLSKGTREVPAESPGWMIQLAGNLPSSPQLSPEMHWGFSQHLKPRLRNKD